MELLTIKQDQFRGRDQRRRENRRIPELLASHMAEISSRVNREMSEKFGVDNFLDKEGRINMQSYADRGSISPESLQQDLDIIRRSDIEWSGMENENVRDFYLERGAKTDEDILRAKKKERVSGKSNHFEIAATSLFYRLFSEEFFVARASVYDDYRNGVDNVLVNKKTGDVVCAFDEVHKDERSSRYEKKERKVQKVAARGGATVKYGFQISDGKLVEKEIKNVPIFCLSIDTDELNKLLSSMSLNLSDKPKSLEIDIMKIFLADLKRQASSLSNIKAIEKSLIGAKRSFKAMRQIFSKYYTETQEIQS